MLKRYAEILSHIHRKNAVNIARQHPPSALFHNGIITTLYVSQSLITKLLFQSNERSDICPKQLYETYLAGNCDSEPSKAMLQGSYFETKCIGSGAYGAVSDLPRHKRTGEKTEIHLRIDESVELFKEVAAEIGLTHNGRNVQIEMERPYLDHQFSDLKVYLRGIADIISPVSYRNIHLDMAVIDLKLAKDVNSTYSDSKRPWLYRPYGDMSKVDKTQAYLYSELFELPFAYLVFPKATDLYCSLGLYSSSIPSTRFKVYKSKFQGPFAVD